MGERVSGINYYKSVMSCQYQWINMAISETHAGNYDHYNSTAIIINTQALYVHTIPSYTKDDNH